MNELRILEMAMDPTKVSESDIEVPSLDQIHRAYISNRPEMDNEILGLSILPTPKRVKESWSILRSRLHPDHGGTVDGFHMANEIYTRTYKRALKNFNGQVDACRECLGTGKVTVTKGFHQIKVNCQYCKGSGKGGTA